MYDARIASEVLPQSTEDSIFRDAGIT